MLSQHFQRMAIVWLASLASTSAWLYGEDKYYRIYNLDPVQYTLYIHEKYKVTAKDETFGFFGNSVSYYTTDSDNTCREVVGKHAFIKFHPRWELDTNAHQTFYLIDWIKIEGPKSFNNDESVVEVSNTSIGDARITICIKNRQIEIKPMTWVAKPEDYLSK